jgi:diguanylate cyclase (GGDEF)-like protein
MKVLIAEDEKISRLRLEKLLEETDFEVESCEDGFAAWEAIRSENKPNILILDWMMPGMDGVEICRNVRTQAKETYTFILLLTSKGRQEDYVKGMEAGADDYIIKPFNHIELMARLRVGKRIVELNEELLSVRDSLQKQANHDKLTGLFNRHYVSEILDREFSRSLRYQTDLSCLLLDLDYFKDINDTFGHPFGDMVLREFSACLKKNARRSDFSFRYGGEEFMLLLPNTGITGARNLAETIRAACDKKRYVCGNQSTTVTVSIGIAFVKQNQLLESKEILTLADKALYRSKAEGRNRVTVYTKDTFGQSTGEKTSENNNFRYLKEKLSLILEKTKKSSIESLELLTCDMGGDEHKQRNHDLKRYIRPFGEKLALPPATIETFKRAANFHDNFKILMGKTFIDRDKVFSRNETIEIEAHRCMSSELTELFDLFTNERSILLYHHENFDGTGYPGGIKENAIPLGARIFAIIDALTAMLSERKYRPKLSPEEMVKELADKAGTQFDPMLVSLFFDIIEKQKLFPIPVEVLEKAREKVVVRKNS